MLSGWIIYEWGKYGVNISYQFVVYTVAIHGYVSSCFTPVLTNHSSCSSVQNQKMYYISADCIS